MKHPVVLFLSSSRIAIETAMKNKRILSKLSVVGYDLPKLKEGKALNEEATLMQMLSKDKMHTSANQSQQVSQQKNATELQYQKHLQLARLTFHGNAEMFQTLQLSEQSEIYGHWLDRAANFYSKILDDEIQIYGLNQQEVVQVKAEVLALIDNRNEEQTLDKEASSASEQKNKAFNLLEMWMHQFRNTACQILKDEPELLEALGFDEIASH